MPRQTKAQKYNMLTDDAFYSTYKTILNPFILQKYKNKEIDPSLIENREAWQGCMLETYGEELQYVLDTAKTKPLHIWTIVEGDDDTIVISAGYHLVNRMGYLITEQPVQSPDGCEDYLCD